MIKKIQLLLLLSLELAQNSRFFFHCPLSFMQCDKSQVEKSNLPNSLVKKGNKLE